ncbi:MAG: monovalent cation:proton antiporter-2 (CPA2) family protein [Alphaproteobacteria bacterium]
MHTPSILIDVLIFLVAAVVIVPVFHRLKTSAILGYLAAGMIIGPHGFSLIGDTDSAHTLAEFGVVFLLFMIGLELSLERLFNMRKYVFGLGLMQVVVTGAVITAIAIAAGVETKAAVIIAGALALSSTAFVLQLLIDRRERATNFGHATFAILLLQDLAVVPLLIMVTTLSQEGTSFVVAFGLSMLQAGVALVVTIWVGRKLFKPVFHLISAAHSSELFVAMTLLSVLGMGWLLSLSGLSMALGAFLAGLLLGETEYRHQIEADVKPFRGLLLGLFFMTIGMTINIAFIIENAGLILGLTLALIVGKTLITGLLCRLFALPLATAIKAGFILSQGGEFGFVLFGAAGALGLIPANLVQIFLAVIAISMAVTPGLVLIGDRLSKMFEKYDEASVADIPVSEKHVLIAGFGRVGQTISKVLMDGGIPYIAIDFDHKRVAECRAKDMPVYFGNAYQRSVLEAAGAGNAAAIVVTLDQTAPTIRIVAELRKNCPDLKIFVRARDMKHLAALKTEGATATVPETAEASLQLGAIVINELGISDDLSASIVQNYRDNDYELLADIVGQNR